MISIVCPVFNASEYLNEAIYSVINQTNDNWELFLIDDGSTDSSGSICDCFASKDERIKVIHKKNNGQMSARLDGVKCCSGKYIVFLDSDDILCDNMVDTLIAKTKEHCNTNLFLFNAEVFPECETNKKLPFVEENLILLNNLDVLEYVFGKQMFGYLWMYCFKKDLLVKAAEKNDAFLNARYTEDAAFVYNVVRDVDGMCVDSAVLYKYRNNPNSITHRLNSDDRHDRFLVFSYIYSDIYFRYKRFRLTNEVSHMICWAMFSYLEHCNSKTTFKTAFRETRKSIIFKKICKRYKTVNKRFLLYKFTLFFNLPTLFYNHI